MPNSSVPIFLNVAAWIEDIGASIDGGGITHDDNLVLLVAKTACNNNNWCVIIPKKQK